MFNLGDVAKDSITGYSGTVIARTEWLHGCIRLTLQAPGMKDGKPLDSYTVDEPQCVLVKASNKPKAAPRHGDRPNVSRASDPKR